MKEQNLKKSRKWYLGMVLLHVTIMHVAYFMLSATSDFPEVLRRPPEALLSIGPIFGVLTGIFQSLGFGRWAFLVPVIARRYSEASEQGQQSLLIVLEAFHSYAGVFIGENLAFICQGIWTFLVSIAIINSLSLT